MGNILITGANGFIGASFTKHLLENTDDTIICPIRKTCDPWRLDLLKSHSKLNVKLIDITTDEINELFNTFQFDYIFHFAGKIRDSDEKTYFRINVDVTKKLIDLCKDQSNLKRFIYFSSLEAVGPSKTKILINENKIPSPITTYGRSKYEAEKLFTSNTFKIPYTIIRIPAVYGPGDVGFYKIKFINFMKKGFVPVIGKNISVCYIDDLMDALFLIYKSEISLYNVYFIADNNVYTWKDIFRAIADALGVNIHCIPLPKFFLMSIAYILKALNCIIKKVPTLPIPQLKEISSPYWGIDTSKLINEIGFSSKVDIKDGMKRLIAYYSEKGWIK